MERSAQAQEQGAQGVVFFFPYQWTKHEFSWLLIYTSQTKWMKQFEKTNNTSLCLHTWSEKIFKQKEKKRKTSWQHCKYSLSARQIQWADLYLPFWSWQIQNQLWIWQGSCCIQRQYCPWSLHWKALDLIGGDPCFASDSWSNCCRKNWEWPNRAGLRLSRCQHVDSASCGC